MLTKKYPATVAECEAELIHTKTQLQQVEHQIDILQRRLAVETRKARNHRVFLYGGVLDGMVPELKNMTETEVKDFLYRAIHSEEAQTFLRNRSSNFTG